MPETLGFIGLGSMGSPIASNLVRAGYGVRVFNRTAEKAARLIALGATTVSRAEEVAEPRRIHTGFKVSDSLYYNLQLRLRDPVGQELRFIRDEIVKARPHSGDRIAVVIDHRKSKADGEQKTGEVLKVKSASTTGGG